jgi:sensor domain CHASE-containing protein
MSLQRPLMQIGLFTLLSAALNPVLNLNWQTSILYVAAYAAAVLTAHVGFRLAGEEAD